MTTDSKYKPLYEKSYALVIGIDDYKQEDGWHRLKTAAIGARKICEILEGEKYGFDEVRILVDDNADSGAIKEGFDWLAEVTGPDDRVLVYFAGHGKGRSAETGEKRGYLIPHGARVGQWSKCLEMKQDVIDESVYWRAKHILFVLDACFSGLALDSTRGEGREKKRTDDLLTRRAIQVITSGQADQEVLDEKTWSKSNHSPFTGALVDRLTCKDEETLTALGLGLYLRNRMVDECPFTPPQVPLVGEARAGGSRGGDFVLRFGVEKESDLPRDLKNLIYNRYSHARLAAISVLTELLEYPVQGDLAREALGRLAQDENKEVSAKAKMALAGVKEAEAAFEKKLRGIWAGSYMQFDRVYPFTLVVEEEGPYYFKGSVVEPIPDWAEYRLASMEMERISGPLPDWVEQWRVSGEMDPNLGCSEWIHLNSMIYGHIDRASGHIVFTKQYIHPEYGIDHRVQYTGTLESGAVAGEYEVQVDRGPFRMVRRME